MAIAERQQAAVGRLPTPVATATDGATRVARLPITGLVCALGARRMVRRVRAIAGVMDARINLAHRSVAVAYDPTQVRLDDLQGAIVRAGYGVRRAAIVLQRAVPSRRPAADAPRSGSSDMAAARTPAATAASHPPGGRSGRVARAEEEGGRR